MIITILGILACLCLYSEIVRAIRIVIAEIKGDEETVERLSMCYELAEFEARKLGVSSELFAKYWEEAQALREDALPYDALKLAEYEHDIYSK